MEPCREQGIQKGKMSGGTPFVFGLIAHRIHFSENEFIEIINHPEAPDTH